MPKKSLSDLIADINREIRDLKESEKVTTSVQLTNSMRAKLEVLKATMRCRSVGEVLRVLVEREYERQINGAQATQDA